MIDEKIKIISDILCLSLIYLLRMKWSTILIWNEGNHYKENYDKNCSTGQVPNSFGVHYEYSQSKFDASFEHQSLMSNFLTWDTIINDI